MKKTQTQTKVLTRKNVAILSATFFALMALFAIAMNAYAIETTSKRHGYVVEEIKYPYTIEGYTTPLEIERQMVRGKLNHRVPEQVAARHMAAMLNYDYDSWMATWDEDERKKLLVDHGLKKQDKQFWETLWTNTFAEYDKFNMTRKVTSRNFIIIEVAATNPEGDVFTVDIPLIKKIKMGVENYYVTDTMKNDPVYESWRIMGAKIQKEAK